MANVDAGQDNSPGTPRSSDTALFHADFISNAV